MYMTEISTSDGRNWTTDSYPELDQPLVVSTELIFR